MTMRSPKSVSPLKIEANRRNAKRSTGPRTERGKRNARFNAVTLGLFAKHVTIPICDGYEPEKDFQSLLDGMHEEFRPVGLYEEWLGVKIAEGMWRLRRASRCESGSTSQQNIWDHFPMPYEDSARSLRLQTEIWALEKAEEELRDTGSLSQVIYQKVQILVEEDRRCEQPEDLVTTDFDREEFLNSIVDRRCCLEREQQTLNGIEEKKILAPYSVKCVYWEERAAPAKWNRRPLDIGSQSQICLATQEAALGLEKPGGDISS
jgi:hypothetical protein